MAYNNSIEGYPDNKLIKNIQKQKLLSVIIDPTLSWDKHVDSVCLGVARKFTLLKLLSKYADKKSLN